MFGLELRKIALPIAAVFALAGGLASHAQAMTVAFQNGADGGGTDRFTVTCGISCEGWLFDAKKLDGSIGGLIGFQNESYATGKGAAWEEALLASVAGETGLSFSKTPENPPTSYSSNALYQLFKIGTTPNVGVLKNTAGVVQDYTFAAIDGEGAGLSHIANYDIVGGGGVTPPSPVPLPAGLPLMLTAVGGLAVVVRRKSRKAV
ncbi:VPLPA-CTERM sorting domain-containing protein [Hoeflea sp.]|uniref:VPLPA-CTERM sorting domain-containing protein n=1 Tax=Hoeflea sp. TaxID=1940281 RepID=UPI0019857FFF|nr:VPLPA-CTERM sorting domain-containing protein [Hoeflea sp.]MBC7285119.1 VPLPA-CTERM sorting domain-containing protein [Hoeflea sp.]